MRTRNSIINSISSFFSYLLLFLGPLFVTPTLDKVLGKNIIGVQSTFLEIISLVSLVELGISFGIIYKLYKPIADEDFAKISSLLNFYKSAFKIISAIILAIGAVTTLFVPLILESKYDKEVFSDSFLRLNFLLYILDLLSTYLFGHKRAMLIADQKNYIVNIIRTSCQILMFTLQILIIKIFRSFTLYVIIKLFCTLLESFIINFQYNKRYKKIDLKTAQKLPLSERKDIFKNLKALFCHAIGFKSLTSFSIIIMTTKLGQAVTGVYYPYSVISSKGMLGLSNQVFNSLSASFGDLMSRENDEKIFDVYKKIYFLNHLVASIIAVFLLCVMKPFIVLFWIKNPSFALPLSTVILITLNIYLSCMRNSISMIKNSAGLYRPDMYCPFIESTINITLAFLLVNKLGINGILIANLVSSILVPFWTQPYIVYNNIFNRSVKIHFKKYLIYFLITVFCSIVSFYLCSLVNFTGLLKVTLNFVISISVVLCINILVFFKTCEFRYLLDTLKKTITKK